MGAFGKAFAAYIQPLLDDTDGSEEQVEKAFMFGQICWNLALAPEDMHQETLDDLQQTFKMDDGEFEDFKGAVVFPMIQRHYDMFPHMHEQDMSNDVETQSMWEKEAPIPAAAEMHSATSPNAPCPCNSGKKYKKCCGRMR